MDKRQLFVINIFCFIILIAVIVFYSLDIKTAYPEWAIKLAGEPIYLFVLYMAIFGISYYNVLLSLLLLIVVIALHMDFLNLVEISYKK